MSITTLMTAADLERLPDDDHRYELVRGELIRMSPVNLGHTTYAHLVSYHLNDFVLPRGLGIVGGEGGFVLEHDPDTVRAPDVHFIRADRVPTGEALDHFGDFAPDLAVEVRSPSDSLVGLYRKADEYFAAGTRLVWIFDPKPKHVHVCTPNGRRVTLGADDTLDGGDVLPGFRLPLRKVFGDG
jgi:Uma2 family endonuclease